MVSFLVKGGENCSNCGEYVYEIGGFPPTHCPNCKSKM